MLSNLFSIGSIEYDPFSWYSSALIIITSSEEKCEFIFLILLRAWINCDSSLLVTKRTVMLLLFIPRSHEITYNLLKLRFIIKGNEKMIGFLNL